MRSIGLLALLLLVGCGDDGGGDPDGGPGDGGPGDGGPGDGGPPVDSGSDAGSDGGPGPGCGDPADYVGDPGWTYEVTVTDRARYCVYNGGESIEEVYRNAAELRLAAGSYRLPDADGDYAIVLPACLRDRSGTTSALAGEGTLTVRSMDFLGDTMREYEVSEPIMLGGERWTIGIVARLLVPAGGAAPPLVLDEELMHGTAPDTSVYYTLCRGACESDLYLQPCAEPGSAGQVYGISFDRGELEVTVHVFPAIGPIGPAGLTTAEGTLDGTSFRETDYFDLAHRPDHHNWGGEFLVRFDSEIAGACGIRAAIPSRDGSFFGLELGASTIDCELGTIDELAGVVQTAPPP